MADQEECPDLIQLCPETGDWIPVDHGPECPHGDCDCEPVIYQRKSAPEKLRGPEPTLWWFEDRFWVKDRDGIPRPGQVYLGLSVEAAGLVPRRASVDSEDFQPGFQWQILRPAKTFPATEDQPELVESGERRHFKKGEWTISDPADPGLDPHRTLGDCPPDCPGQPVSILIPVSEARKRCGVEDDRDGVRKDLEWLLGFIENLGPRNGSRLSVVTARLWDGLSGTGKERTDGKG